MSSGVRLGGVDNRLLSLKNLSTVYKTAGFIQQVKRGMSQNFFIKCDIFLLNILLKFK